MKFEHRSTFETSSRIQDSTMYSFGSVGDSRRSDGRALLKMSLTSERLLGGCVADTGVASRYCGWERAVRRDADPEARVGAIGMMFVTTIFVTARGGEGEKGAECVDIVVVIGALSVSTLRRFAGRQVVGFGFGESKVGRSGRCCG